MLTAAVEAWRAAATIDEQVWLLDFAARNGLLPNEGLRPLVMEYRKLEEEIPVARRAPGCSRKAGPTSRCSSAATTRAPATAFRGVFSRRSGARTIRTRA